MTESKRQKQVAQLLLEVMNDIFLKEGLNTFQGGMVSISKVQVTPDLLEARIYLSLYKVEEPSQYMDMLEANKKEIRYLLGGKVRHQLRRIPELRFFADDTLEYVSKMEDLFKKIEDERKQIGGQNAGKDAASPEGDAHS